MCHGTCHVRHRSWRHVMVTKLSLEEMCVSWHVSWWHVSCRCVIKNDCVSWWIDHVSLKHLWCHVSCRCVMTNSHMSLTTVMFTCHVDVSWRANYMNHGDMCHTQVSSRTTVCHGELTTCLNGVMCHVDMSWWMWTCWTVPFTSSSEFLIFSS